MPNLELPPIELTPQQEEERYAVCSAGESIIPYYTAQKLLSLQMFKNHPPRLLEFLEHSYPGDYVRIGRVVIIHIRRNWDAK